MCGDVTRNCPQGGKTGAGRLLRQEQPETEHQEDQGDGRGERGACMGGKGGLLQVPGEPYLWGPHLDRQHISTDQEGAALLARETEEQLLPLSQAL